MKVATISRFWWPTALALVVATGCGQKSVVGRWTARELSVQFEKDHRVTVVTTDGVSRGKYYLDAEHSPPQLVLQTTSLRTDRDTYTKYDLEFIGSKFLNLTETRLVINDKDITRRRAKKFLLERAEPRPNAAAPLEPALTYASNPTVSPLARQQTEGATAPAPAPAPDPATVQ